MAPQRIHSNTITLPPEIAEKMEEKEFIPILTEEGVLLKTVSTDVLLKARGMLTNPNLSVNSFLARKHGEKELER